MLGGEKEDFHIPLLMFQDMPNFSADLAELNLTVAIDPQAFYFLQNQPHSAWCKLSDLSYHLPGDIGSLDLSSVLVRLAFQRHEHMDYVLNIEACLAHEHFDLAAANKTPWALSTQIRPVILATKAVHIFSDSASCLELLPFVQRTDNTGDAVSDSSLRFLSFKTLLDACSVQHLSLIHI